MIARFVWFLAGLVVAGVVLTPAMAGRTPIEEILAANIKSDLELIQALRSGKGERDLDRVFSRIERDLRRQRHALQ